MASRKSMLSNDEIRARRAAGETYVAIAKVAGLGKQRVRNICSKTEDKPQRGPVVACVRRSPNTF